jgi:hypothetical protein
MSISLRDYLVIGVWTALCVWLAYATTPQTPPTPVPNDPPAYCYSNVRGMGFPCADLKGEFNV